MSDAFELLTRDEQTLVMHLADEILDKLSAADIILVSPMDYGDILTDDHKNYTWSALVDLIAELSIEDWEDIQETLAFPSEEQDEMLDHFMHYIHKKNTSWEDYHAAT
jgi:hypothetical protein